MAYAFGLQGPCNGIDTACSSSLVSHWVYTCMRLGIQALNSSASLNNSKHCFMSSKHIISSVMLSVSHLHFSHCDY